MPDQIWTLWWAWIVLGFALGVVEIFAPGFIFLGFAVGAGLTGVLVGLGIGAGLPLLLLIFAVLSLIAWAGLRRLSGKRPGQVKVWDRDINDNHP
ncbi:NfeD family protein [Neotabrizicola sp. VNH66]|uniref:NfeD family protein n=1 Tax=Neotabrizicola sp. VNH66 TaxID=3400918 RepID=UPI003C10158F